jgi:hypothetical protein
MAVFNGKSLCVDAKDGQVLEEQLVEKFGQYLYLTQNGILVNDMDIIQEQPVRV